MLIPSGGSKGESVTYLFELLEATCILCLVAPSSHHSYFLHHISSSDSDPPAFLLLGLL